MIDVDKEKKQSGVDHLLLPIVELQRRQLAFVFKSDFIDRRQALVLYKQMHRNVYPRKCQIFDFCHGLDKKQLQVPCGK